MFTKALVLLGTIALAWAQATPKPAAPTAAAPKGSCTNKVCDPFAEYCENNECKCVTECPPMLGDTVCTNGGKQYPSRCEFYRDQCLCKQGQSTCTNRGVENEYILFYSICSNRQLRRANTQSCVNYNNRLAKWFEKMLRVRQSQRYTTGTEKSDYMQRLYQNELKLYSALDANEQSMSQTVVMHGQTSATYDPALLTLWFCILDRNGDGILNERESSQITRVLLPACPCIENFLNNCRSGDTEITLAEFLGDDCFKVAADKQTKTCQALRLNPSGSV